MTVRTIVITGASDGIGAAAARQLAGKGHRLLLVGRSRNKTEAIARQAGGEPFIVDFASFADVRRVADDIRQAVGDGAIHVLANNARGILGDPAPTIDGNEQTMQINHLAPFLLTNLLMPQLLLGKAAIINTSSVGHRLFGHLDVDDLNNARKFNTQKAYGDAKLANVLFTKSLVRRFAGPGITSVAFHPGNVRTSFAAGSRSPMRFVYHTFLKNLMLIDADKGGANLVWFIEGSASKAWQSGAYYDQTKLTDKVNPQVNDEALAEALWKRSADIVGADASRPVPA